MLKSSKLLLMNFTPQADLAGNAATPGGEGVNQPASGKLQMREVRDGYSGTSQPPSAKSLVLPEKKERKRKKRGSRAQISAGVLSRKYHSWSWDSPVLHNSICILSRQRVLCWASQMKLIHGKSWQVQFQDQISTLPVHPDTHILPPRNILSSGKKVRRSFLF